MWSGFEGKWLMLLRLMQVCTGCKQRFCFLNLSFWIQTPAATYPSASIPHPRHSIPAHDPFTPLFSPPHPLGLLNPNLSAVPSLPLANSFTFSTSNPAIILYALPMPSNSACGITSLICSNPSGARS